jgi:precorrin-3B synthase
LAYPPSASLRPSACPALARIVAARDGGLCRIKLPGGTLLARQAIAIADATDAHASGVLELTNRANLQVRGVKPDGEMPLSRRLFDAGLGPRVRASESLGPEHAARQALAADDARNLLLSPVAGLDAGALYDTSSLAEQILDLLQNEPRFAELSPKFSVLLDGGERLAALDHPHDVWFAAMPAASGASVQPRFAVGLAGQPSDALAAVRADDVAALACALLHTFLDLAAPQVNRMRDLLRSRDSHCVLAQAAANARIDLQRDAAVSTWRRAVAEPARRFGAYAQRQAGLWHVGGQPPLGRLDTAMLRALARLASAHGDGTLRCTPWQSVLVPNIAERAVAQVEQGLRALGFALDAHNPLARVIACAGSAGCAKGLSDTKSDALHLARQLPAGVEAHLSGCTRSCAAAHCAPYTLLAVEPARYDLYRRVQAPERESSPAVGDAARFGERIGTHMTIEDAANQLGQSTRSLKPMIEYVRDGKAIYRQSFATIRAEADLSGVPDDLEKLVVRVIHACGMVDIASAIRYSNGAGAAGRAALANGAPILCDSRMVADGITRARLPASNAVLCMLGDPSVPELAKTIGNTRSAAALELWRRWLEGSIVAIGNAPTALFYLLEMLDAGAPRPALILGFPVGFVGAAESKAMLAADSRGVPYVIVEGRRGGSAMAAAAVNALASEVE